MIYYWISAGIVLIFVLFLSGMRVVRPTTRGLEERLGEYRRFANPGFNWIIPIIDRMYRINIAEVMVDAKPQQIIKSDKLNASENAQVYFKAKSDEDNVKNSRYGVFDYKYQIVNLARMTLRNIIGTMSIKYANSERGKINSELQKTLREETAHLRIEIVRTELKKIDPPADVQETMNKVVKTENKKVATVDFATATEPIADGARRAEIKKAEGIRLVESFPLIACRLSVELDGMKEILCGVAGSEMIDLIRAETSSHLQAIRGLMKDEQILYRSNLRLSQEAPQLSPCDRPLRIGVFPTAAGSNPDLAPVPAMPPPPKSSRYFISTIDSLIRWSL